MKKCIDCLNFKLKKGWKYAYCDAGHLIMAHNDDHSVRLFEFEHPTEAKFNISRKVEYQKNLISRSKNMEVLNRKECASYV